jgi:HNH endonuclease/Holliday junction resolvase RuvA-like protein
MLRDAAREAGIEIGAVASWGSEQRFVSGPDWRMVDRALRAIRQRRAALDAEEVRWLREAEALEIWRPLGMVSALDYMERVLGYAPRTAQERLRVARALGDLPQLTAALAADELAFSAVRELTRVATPGTEASWIAAAAGKNLRQIEELVADHGPGDRPDDPPDPRARTHVVRLELAAETFALLRQARTALDDEHGSNLSDDRFVAAMCSAVLDGATATETAGRAKYQIAVTVCQRCRQGWQDGAGAQIAIEAAAVDRAMCDAQHIGSIDSTVPERAYRDISPSTARLVWRRDGGRCRVPGCRSARGLEIHHLVHRADSGSHDASNVCLLCSACHLAHHRGALRITGTADQLEVRRPGDAPRAGGPVPCARSTTPIVAVRADADVHGDAPTREDTGSAALEANLPTASDADAGTRVGVPGAASNAARPEIKAVSKLDAAILCTQARAALTGLGWKPAIAHAAVDAAAAAQGTGMTLERLIFESLRRCPAPRA